MDVSRYYKNVVDMLPDGIVALDLQGKIVSISQQLVLLLGLPQQSSATGHSFIEFIQEQERARFQHELDTYIQRNRKNHPLRHYIKRQDHTLYLADIYVSFLYDQQEVSGILLLIRDISHQDRLRVVLSENQYRQQAILDSAPYPIWLKDKHGRFILGNQALFQFFGLTLEQLDSASHAVKELLGTGEKQVLSTKDNIVFESQVCNIKGNVRWLETVKAPILGEEGQVTGTVGFARDITVRKNTEESLRETNAVNELLLNSLPFGISIIGHEGQILFANSNMSKIYTNACGIHCWEARNCKEPCQSCPVIQKLNGGQARTLESVINNKVYHVSHTPILFKGISSYLAIFYDITEQRDAEAKIREQANLLSLTHEAIIVRDMNDLVSFWNHGAERLYWWTAQEVTGKNSLELLQINEADKQQAKNITIQTGSWKGELNVQTKTGVSLTVLSHWTLLLDENKQPKAILSVNSDITEMRKIQSQFLRAQRMEGIGTLASGIAHDLNNILSPIIMGTTLLREPLDMLSKESIISQMEASAKRGADIVKQVLTFARGVRSSSAPLHPNHLVSEMAKICNETFPKHIQIKTQLPKGIWSVKIDPTQLHQILLNLCVNARDAMPKGGTLGLTLRNTMVSEAQASNQVSNHAKVHSGPHVLLEISDTGVGIPTAILPKIFDPFFTTKSPDMGTGLGLSTVIGIVNSHSGFIDVVSQENRGTTFKVYLPAEQTVTTENSGVTEELPHGHGEHVLLVDDETPLQTVVRKMLESHGYMVSTASDGTEALSIYLKPDSNIDLVLTDMMMPFMDGLALIRALRRVNQDAHIIAYSGMDGMLSTQELQDLGVTTLLPKPLTAKQLLDSIASELQKPKLSSKAYDSAI